jgi:hypothetical protein
MSIDCGKCTKISRKLGKTLSHKIRVNFRTKVISHRELQKLESRGRIGKISAKKNIIRNFKGIDVIFIYQQDFKINLKLVGLESNKCIRTLY